MSKKKNKFKKNKSHKAPFSQSTSRSSQETAGSIMTGAEPTREISETTDKPTVAIEDETQSDPRYLAVRQDVKKILVTFACLGLILVGTYFLDQKTSVLDNLGNWIYRISNIQVL